MNRRNQALLSSPLFRMNLKMAGKHPFNSTRWSSIFAEGLSQRFPTWSPTMKNFELEIFGYLRFSRLYLGLTLTPGSQAMQQLSQDRNLGITPLRPAIAYALTASARVTPGGP